MRAAPLIFLAATLLALVACNDRGQSATLSWTAPATHVDGSPLRDLDGYFIYFGADPKRFTHAVKIQGANLNHYVVEGLAPGKYYFSVAAYTASGVQSGLSPPVAKVIGSSDHHDDSDRQ